MTTDYDTPRTSAADAEPDEHLEDVRAVTGTRTAQQPDVEQDDAELAESFELPGADLSGESLDIVVDPQHGDEFVCSRCFLVRHDSQLADANDRVCRDCA